ncbi:hypothetical protein [Nocardia thailandica]|nr:hypothetical protein [Nocardia thailandica]
MSEREDVNSPREYQPPGYLDPTMPGRPWVPFRDPEDEPDEPDCN